MPSRRVGVASACLHVILRDGRVVTNIFFGYRMKYLPTKHPGLLFGNTIQIL